MPDREMKDSGIEWVHKIPINWQVHPVSYYYSERKNKNVGVKEDNLLSLSYGNIVKKDINTSEGLLPASFSTYNIIEPGDIIIRPTDLQNDKRSLRTGLVTERGIITSAYIDLAPKRIIDARYFHYLLHTYDVIKVFYNMGNGVRQGLNYDEFGRLMVFEPPLPEQHRIADFLDSKCSQIDEISKKIQEEIDTLEEYKKSIITEAVTKGLDPNVEMKDSGIEWIGEIPLKWQVKKISYVSKSVSDIDHFMPKDFEGIDAVPYIMIGDLKDSSSLINYGGAKHVSPEDYKMLSRKSRIEYGDVIIARYATIGTVCYVDTDKDMLVSYACLTIKTNSLMNGKYMYYYFKSSAFLEDVSQYINSNTQGNVGKDSLYKTKITVPPINIQEEIEEYLDEKTATINGFIEAKQQQLSILEEYKKSLIYEYVTGKKEVPICC